MPNVSTRTTSSLGLAGIPDRELRDRVGGEVLLLTQDADFLAGEPTPFAIIVVSRGRQVRRLVDHVDVCLRALRQLLAHPLTERQFELLDTGELKPWRQASSGAQTGPSDVSRSNLF